MASGIALDFWLATALLIVLSLPFLLYRAITEDRVLQAEKLPATATTRPGCAGACCLGDLVRRGRELPRAVNPAPQYLIRIRHLMEYIMAALDFAYICNRPFPVRRFLRDPIVVR